MQDIECGSVGAVTDPAQEKRAGSKSPPLYTAIAADYQPEFSE